MPVPTLWTFSECDEAAEKAVAEIVLFVSNQTNDRLEYPTNGAKHGNVLFST